jgi:hypothetical protein
VAASEAAGNVSASEATSASKASTRGATKVASAKAPAAHRASEVTAAATAASMTATTAAPATARQCVGRNGGASQRRRDCDDRNLVQYRSHHGMRLLFEMFFVIDPTGL